MLSEPVWPKQVQTDSRSQIRQGIANNSKGTAFVVYEDVHDAKQACDKLNGFNFQNRYLVGMYHSASMCAHLTLQSYTTSRRKCYGRRKTSRKGRRIWSDSNSSTG
jgi:hypothetical protein